VFLCWFSSADEERAGCNQWIDPQSCSTNQFNVIVRGHYILPARPAPRPTLRTDQSRAYYGGPAAAGAGARAREKWATPSRDGSRCASPSPSGPCRPTEKNLEFTGLTQNLGQLYGFYRDFQSNFWVNLRILGQPCEFHLGRTTATSDARSPRPRRRPRPGRGTGCAAGE
jgi:hypothetical protein